MDAALFFVEADPGGDRGYNAEWDHGEEGPSPVDRFRHDTAEDRTEHRPEDPADTPHHQNHGVEMLRETSQKHPLAERLQRRPEDALQDAIEDEGFERIRGATQDGRDGEADYRANQQPKGFASRAALRASRSSASRWPWPLN